MCKIQFRKWFDFATTFYRLSFKKFMQLFLYKYLRNLKLKIILNKNSYYIYRNIGLTWIQNIHFVTIEFELNMDINRFLYQLYKQDLKFFASCPDIDLAIRKTGSSTSIFWQMARREICFQQQENYICRAI